MVEEILVDYVWLGNVWELENVINWVYIFVDGEWILLVDFLLDIVC